MPRRTLLMRSPDDVIGPATYTLGFGIVDNDSDIFAFRRIHVRHMYVPGRPVFINTMQGILCDGIKD